MNKTTKKVGILTLHRALNYGAVWQCWALKTACEKLGCTVETIDYNPFGHYTYKSFLKHRPDKALTNIRRFYYFNQFVKKMLNPSFHTESHEWISQNPPKDDIYIVGSDTVWCPKVVGHLLNSYLLDFAPENTNRISYAASLGGIFIEDKDIELFTKELKKFTAISIREPQFVNKIQELCQKEVVDVCDPTLLLSKEDYMQVEKKKRIPKHYIAVFDLAGDTFVKETALKLKEKLGYPIVNLTGKFLKWVDYNNFGLLPQEWIYMMRKADFVCTNSFHGTAFAMIFERPFVCCQAKIGSRAKTNVRVENLLTQTKLVKQYITELNQLESAMNIDYSVANNHIDKYRQRSFQWLKNAIEQ